MKPVHIFLMVLTLAFLLTLGALAYRDRQEQMVFMTEAEAFAFVEAGGV